MSLTFFVDMHAVHIDKEGQPHLQNIGPLPDNEWGFRAGLLRDYATKMRWQDHDIIQSLEHGFRYQSDDTSPVLTLPQHQRKAYVYPQPFYKFMWKEIECSGSVQQPLILRGIRVGSFQATSPEKDSRRISHGMQRILASAEIAWERYSK